MDCTEAERNWLNATIHTRVMGRAVVWSDETPFDGPWRYEVRDGKRRRYSDLVPDYAGDRSACAVAEERMGALGVRHAREYVRALRNMIPRGGSLDDEYAMMVASCNVKCRAMLDALPRATRPLPSIHDLHALKLRLPGNMDSADYVRAIRNGDPLPDE